jgi:selenide,water dikinase
MQTLNRGAAEALQRLDAGAVHACTDVTGFGLIGHATEMARASGVTIVIGAGGVPLFSGVLDIAELNRSGGMGSNQEHFAPSTHVEPDVERLHEIILYDPQTSGGLLIAADAASADEVAVCLSRAGVTARPIGVCEAAQPGIAVRVKP